MTASIKEVLERCRNYIASPLRMSNDDDEKKRRDDIVMCADQALASLESGDARERIARIIDPGSFYIRDESNGLMCTVECNGALAAADAILASGLAPNEASIRADEREKQKERDARILTAPVEGVELQRFICGGTTCTDTRGNDLFIAKSDVERLLTERAAAIRAGRGE